MLAESDIERITATIARSCVSLVVGVFGSYGVGTARVSSDLDVFVITETTIVDPSVKTIMCRV